jgi:hypothetical protein
MKLELEFRQPHFPGETTRKPEKESEEETIDER